MSDSELFPGERLPRAEAETVFDKFVATFRDISKENNLPSHCSGLPLYCVFIKRLELFWGNIFDEDWISDDTQAYFMDETPACRKFSQRIHLTSLAEYRRFLAKRLPQMFGDYYLFDLNYTWCIIINHDDLSFYAEVDMPQEEERD